jgi:hypothetical protein
MVPICTSSFHSEHRILLTNCVFVFLMILRITCNYFPRFGNGPLSQSKCVYVTPNHIFAGLYKGKNYQYITNI